MGERDRIDTRLQRAIRRQRLVVVQRCIKGDDPVHGYVVGVGRKWLLLHQFDSHVVSLNGHTALRRADVVAVRHKEVSADFVRRSLELHGEWPPSAPTGEVSLERTRDLVASAGRVAPLVTVHTERRDPEVCYIGIPVATSRRAVRLHEIGPDATWDHGVTAWRLKDITKVDFGGRYEAALWEVGGPPEPV
jgi:hypothetical protein